MVQCLVLYAVATQSHLLAILLSAWQRKHGVGMCGFHGISSVELACMGKQCGVGMCGFHGISSVELACTDFMA